jgi:hypothetical protein
MDQELLKVRQEIKQPDWIEILLKMSERARKNKIKRQDDA